MDRLAAGAVLVGVAAVLELLQRPALGHQLDHLELEQMVIGAELTQNPTVF
ncbi:hypothetical protein D3C78_1937400 [compost metagenome]